MIIWILFFYWYLMLIQICRKFKQKEIWYNNLCLTDWANKVKIKNNYDIDKRWWCISKSTSVNLKLFWPFFIWHRNPRMYFFAIMSFKKIYVFESTAKTFCKVKRKNKYFLKNQLKTLLFLQKYSVFKRKTSNSQLKTDLFQQSEQYFIIFIVNRFFLYKK